MTRRFRGGRSRERGRLAASPLAGALEELARHWPAERLREAAALATVRATVGAWLAKRVMEVTIRDNAWTILIYDPVAAEQTRACESEVLARLRDRIGRHAPGRLFVRSAAGSVPRVAPPASVGRAAPGRLGPLTEDAVARLPTGEARELFVRLVRAVGTMRDP